MDVFTAESRQSLDLESQLPLPASGCGTTPIAQFGTAVWPGRSRARELRGAEAQNQRPRRAIASSTAVMAAKRNFRSCA